MGFNSGFKGLIKIAIIIPKTTISKWLVMVCCEQQRKAQASQSLDEVCRGWNGSALTSPNRTSRRVRRDETQSNPEQCGKLEFPRSGEKSVNVETECSTVLQSMTGQSLFAARSHVVTTLRKMAVITLNRRKVREKPHKYSSVWSGSVWEIVCKSWTGNSFHIFEILSWNYI